MRVISAEIMRETVAGETVSSPVNIEHIYGFSVQAAWDVNTPAADTFTDADIAAADDEITITAHDFVVGIKGQFTTTDTLPTGLSLLTDYWLIVVDANTVKVAASLADAIAGTAVAIDADGVGTHTFTPTSIAGGAVKLQVTNDDATKEGVTPRWDDIGSSSQNVTADGGYMWNLDAQHYRFMRVYSTLTAGRYAIVVRLQGKGV